MPNGTYGGVRGRKTKVGRKLLRFPPTRLLPRGSAPIILEDLRQILKYRLRRYSLCLGALPLLYPAAPPSVFAFGKYTALAVALGREYVVELQGALFGFLRS